MSPIATFGVLALVCAVITGIAYNAGDRPGDDFGAIVPVLLFAVLTIIFLVCTAIATLIHFLAH